MRSGSRGIARSISKPRRLLIAKGFVWLATRPSQMGMLAVEGNSCVLSPGAQWLADIPQHGRNFQFRATD